VSVEAGLAAITRACEREIERGLTACQVAVARENELLFEGSFGSATPRTRFWVASATKPIVSSAVWLLLGDGRLELTRPVADYVPEFAAHDKHAVTVEQVLLMTCGFPEARMPTADGVDRARRLARLAEWTLEHEPGERYVYHPESAHWVLAELIERASGEDFRDFVDRRIARPLGLPRLLGIPHADQTDVAQLSPAADARTRELYDYAAKIAAGEPGGGGVMTAATLARFYQALLHDPVGIWPPDLRADGIGNVRCRLPDPLLGLPANRTLGVVVGAGFGATWGASQSAFGWPGAGGQVGFAEPATGVSFAFLQMGDSDPVSPFARGVRLSNLALALGR
jgi:CubicO group peptidase (beta-lactamase class C family)